MVNMLALFYGHPWTPYTIVVSSRFDDYINEMN